MIEDTRQKEDYLFTIARKILHWADCKDYTEAELANLVMFELLDIKEGSARVGIPEN